MNQLSDLRRRQLDKLVDDYADDVSTFGRRQREPMKTYRVPLDYRTIKEAVAAAKEDGGGEVFVAAGHYLSPDGIPFPVGADAPLRDEP